MNRKIILIAIIALMLSMSVVSAQQFKNKDFDGFSIDVPKNSNFEKQAVEGDSVEFMEDASYIDEKNQMVIEYVESPMFSEENIDFFYQNMFNAMNLDLDKCYETQIGNMKLLYPMKTSDTNLAIAGINNGNQTVMIFGADVDLIKQMGKTVEFN